MKRLLLGAAFAALLAGPAAALTVNVTTAPGAPDPGLPGGYTILYDFDGNDPGANLTGNYTIFTTPSGTGNSAPPAGSPPGNNYLSVPNPQSAGSADLLFGGGHGSVSFYWGSVDTYNTLELLDVNGDSFYTILGGSLPPANGNQADANSNIRVTIVADRNIHGLRLSSSQFAFEADTFGVTGAVPEPATWAMMIGGLGFVGAAMRRRRTNGKVVTA